jgi:divalent metal cation (Fe/Co/Zn/Cd) transporter
MVKQSGYQKQKNLSLFQFLAEVPNFVITLLSALFSGTLLVYADLLDSLSYVSRHMMVVLLSRKLSKDLRFEYNYGVSKIEAFSSLLCDSIVLFGMFLTFCLSIYSFTDPAKPSKILIAVAGLKLLDVLWSLAFFNEQRKLLKTQGTSIARTSYAAAFGDLLFDGVSFVSLLAMWLLRDNPIGGYISPVVTIFVAVYLALGCIKRIRSVLNELTDKTLPEEQQMKLLSILARHFDRYSQFHAIDSRMGGNLTRVDICLSFEDDTRVKEVVDLQKQMQDELSQQIGDCIVKITMGEG